MGLMYCLKVWHEHYLKKPGKTGFSIPEDTMKNWQENSLRWPNVRS